MIMPKNHSIVGDLINFRGLVYAPLNENGVVFLFGKVLDDLHMYVEEIKPGFPDCVARRFTGKGWERVTIEFEFMSSSFKSHGHDPEDCDIIVCWEHDWKGCPLEVIELKSEILSMKNWPVRPPTVLGTPAPDGRAPTEQSKEDALAALFVHEQTQPAVQELYRGIERAMTEWNAEIWTNVGKKYIGMYSPEKSFASFNPAKTTLRIECFGRGAPLAGTKLTNPNFSPRWARFSVKTAEQLHEALAILKESHARLKAAIKAGETTGYFSGGVAPGAAQDAEPDTAEGPIENPDGTVERAGNRT